MDLSDTPELAEYRTRVRSWPAEYGGQGLDPLHQVVINPDIGRAGASARVADELFREAAAAA